MCLIAWNWQPSETRPLLLLANRDEFYARPALPLHWWENGEVLAGKDLQAGGTWLGLGRTGRLAALTNHRQPFVDSDLKPSRGMLVTDFLQGHMSASDYLEAVAVQTQRYKPFNLLLYDGQELMGLESRHKRILSFSPGVGAVSNADFDTPWPKVLGLKAGLQNLCHAERTSKHDLLALLQDRTLANDTALPRTGVALELERTLSATWIASEHYGTRASSIVSVEQTRACFFEQSYDASGPLTATQQIFTRVKPGTGT